MSSVTQASGSAGRVGPNPAYGWVIVAVTFVSMALVFGSRFSLGLFLPYLPEALDTSAAAVSGAFAVSMLAAAVMQPLSGVALDRLGGRVVLSIGLGCAGLALCGTAVATALWQVTLFMGLASSVAYAAVSPVSVTSIVSSWFAQRRGMALGIATSGTKVALIILPPAIAAVILGFGWRAAMFALGVLMWLLIPAVLAFVRPAPGSVPASRVRRAASGRPTAEEVVTAADDLDGPAAAPSVDKSLLEALKVRVFWLIAISLFANGFIMNLIFIHLPSFVLSLGYDQSLAATGLAVLGGIGIVGNIVTGALSDRLGRRIVLLIMFGARGVTTLYLVLAPGPVSLIAFLVVFGLLGYGAIAVMGALASDIFGRRSIGAILGTAYVFNQIGGAAGVYAGGVSLEWTGDYTMSLWIAVATTALSVVCVSLLRGEAVARPQRSAAPT